MADDRKGGNSAVTGGASSAGIQHTASVVTAGAPNAITSPGAADSINRPALAEEPAAISSRRPLKSNKLDRTLVELENAFAAWDSIVADAPATTKAKSNEATDAAAGKKNSASAGEPGNENDFRSKTRKLLNQLRDQLADLSED